MAHAPTRVPVARSGAVKVLLIDPDPVSREILERAMQTETRRVVTSVGDFGTAWAILTDAREPFDVVFADPSTLGVTGFEWLQRIRTATRSQPVALVLCVEPEPTAMAHAVEIGVRHFVFKPCSRNAVAAKLRQLELARSCSPFGQVGAVF
jgi:DNA-binding response OmpR family regulator